jgi:mannosyl-oligosaccharide alpha-1,2-mannosidase
MKRSTFLASAVSAAAPGSPLVTLSPSKGGRAQWRPVEAIPKPSTVADQVRQEFLHAWNGYKQFAWGADEVAPISGKPKNFFVPTHSFGLSIIEAMDTLYVMGADDELEACVKWLRSNLNFDVDASVQMFEAVIRMVAGLMTGYYATGERFLLDGARDLADRLLVCFTKSPSGAPYRYANLKTGAVSDPKSNLAEIGSNVLEFGDLSRLTGDPKYLNASMKAFETAINKRSALNLLGTDFDVEKGEFIGTDDVAPDEPVDSFYEYLWGGWQMLGIAQCRDWYRMLTDALLKYKVTHVDGNLWFKTVDYTTGLPTGDASSSELAAFYAELAAKGGDRAIGEAFYDSWTRALDRYELIPEVIFYPDLSIIDARYWMRPEYPNSSFDLWFLTHDQKYRATAYQYFTNLRTYCRTPNGYTVLTDVRTRPMTQGDYFPAYSFSENFKYLYLTFADSPRFDGSNYYLNTEGKVLRGMLKATA